MPDTITCPVCGTQRRVQSGRKYCSRKCFGLDQRGRKFPHSPEHKENRLIATRAANAKRVYVKTGPRPTGVIEKMQAGLAAWKNANPGKALALAKENLPKDVAMEKNPNWRGGKTKEVHSFYTRNAGALKIWRSAVMERDGGRCKDCGTTGKLDCHHILPLAATRAFAFHRANGVMLCRQCHAKTDGYAGRGNSKKGRRLPRAGNITIMFIPQHWQDYDTVGNWQFADDGSLLVLVSRMGNPVYEQAIALHETAEALLCRAAGVTTEQVDAWDMGEGKDLDEPGNDPRAPYHEQHVFATSIERAFIEGMGIEWDAYDRAVGDHGAREDSESSDSR